LEVATKIKGSQGRKRVRWVKPEHPYTAISPKTEVGANHNEALNSSIRRRCTCIQTTYKYLRQKGRRITKIARCTAAGTQLGTPSSQFGERDNPSYGTGIIPQADPDRRIIELALSPRTHHGLTDQCHPDKGFFPFLNTKWSSHIA
jgi:hypothetical protein